MGKFRTMFGGPGCCCGGGGEPPLFCLPRILSMSPNHSSYSVEYAKKNFGVLKFNGRPIKQEDPSFYNRFSIPDLYMVPQYNGPPSITLYMVVTHKNGDQTEAIAGFGGLNSPFGFHQYQIPDIEGNAYPVLRWNEHQDDYPLTYRVEAREDKTVIDGAVLFDVYEIVKCSQGYDHLVPDGCGIFMFRPSVFDGCVPPKNARGLYADGVCWCEDDIPVMASSLSLSVPPDTHDLAGWQNYNGPYCKYMHDTGIKAPGSCNCNYVQCQHPELVEQGIEPKWKARLCNPNNCKFFEL